MNKKIYLITLLITVSFLFLSYLSINKMLDISPEYEMKQDRYIHTTSDQIIDHLGHQGDRDYDIFNQIRLHTEDDPYIIIDPYNSNKLSALIGFRTKSPAYVIAVVENGMPNFLTSDEGVSSTLAP